MLKFMQGASGGSGGSAEIPCDTDDCPTCSEVCSEYYACHKYTMLYLLAKIRVNGLYFSYPSSKNYCSVRMVFLEGICMYVL